jgi:quercetin dioxygenase-like cupin family protein
MSQPTVLSSDDAQALTLADATHVAESGIVSRTLLQTPEVRVTLFTFAEGQELTPHTSRRRALVQILDGACEFLFAGKWQRLAAGTFLHLPPNHLHAVKAAGGPFSMLLTLGSEPAGTTSNPLA